jgi:hypothetical protein
MGNSSYSESRRYSSASAKGYFSKSRDEIFVQQKVGKSHESMNPKNIKFRESRDSEAHPESIPVQLYLDVTGSMLSIPEKMIKDGLPTMMSTMIQNGAEHVSLLFGAIGDHECDRHPLQIGQFESGDEELDMWLERTYLESGGGGNRGESYPLAWYFAANHTISDAWEKRKQKGFIFTIGDEPFLEKFPTSAIKEIMGDTAVGQATYTAEDLYRSACERNHVYHIFVNHNGMRKGIEEWRELLGQNLIVIEDHTQIPNLIARTVNSVIGSNQSNFTPVETVSDTTGTTTGGDFETMVNL